MLITVITASNTAAAGDAACLRIRFLIDRSDADAVLVRHLSTAWRWYVVSTLIWWRGGFRNGLIDCTDIFDG